MPFSSKFAFSDGLEFPTDNAGNIVPTFSKELLDKCLDRDHIVINCSGSSIQHIIPYTFINAIKDVYGNDKCIYFNSYEGYQTLGRYSDVKSIALPIPYAVEQYPSPIFLNDNIAFINTSYHYNAISDEVVIADSFSEVWENIMLPWKNEYKYKFEGIPTNHALAKMNPSYPTLFLMLKRLTDKHKLLGTFYADWGPSEVEVLMYLLKGKKINVVVMSDEYWKYSKIEGLVYLKFHPAMAIKVLQMSHYLISNMKHWHNIALAISNADLILQKSLLSIKDQVVAHGVNNNVIEVDELTPEEAYRILYNS